MQYSFVVKVFKIESSCLQGIPAHVWKLKKKYYWFSLRVSEQKKNNFKRNAAAQRQHTWHVLRWKIAAISLLLYRFNSNLKDMCIYQQGMQIMKLKIFVEIFYEQTQHASSHRSLPRDCDPARKSDVFSSVPWHLILSIGITFHCAMENIHEIQYVFFCIIIALYMCTIQ